MRTRRRASAARGSSGRKKGADIPASSPDHMWYVIYVRRLPAGPQGPRTGPTVAHYSALARYPSSRQTMFVLGVYAIKAGVQDTDVLLNSQRHCSAMYARQARKYVPPRPATRQSLFHRPSMVPHSAATAGQLRTAGRQLPLGLARPMEPESRRADREHCRRVEVPRNQMMTS